MVYLKKDFVMNDNNNKMGDTTYTMIGLILIAYLFSFGMRMIWVLQLGNADGMGWNGEIMINTNDGYYFAVAVQDYLNAMATGKEYHSISSALNDTPAIIYIIAWSAKILPFPLETILLYSSAAISSLVVIPIVLSFRLIGQTFMGFLAALIGSIAWSYYNRTMVGYFDSDMFALFLQFMIFYTFLHVAYKKDLLSVFLAATFIILYPYFYPQGMTIAYAMFIVLISYLGVEHMGWLKTHETTPFKGNHLSFFASAILLSIALMMAVPVEIRIGLLLVMGLVLVRVQLSQKVWFIIATIFFISFLYFGNILNIIYNGAMGYFDRGVQDEGLKFFKVIGTVREAGGIPMSTVADRISGSSLGLLISAIGYLFLVMRHKPFIIGLPLIGVGLFSYYGGLRFTVYAVPIAAMSAVYFFWFVGGFAKNIRVRNGIVVAGTALMLYPNVKHIQEYMVPTVFNTQEVSTLDKLKSISKVDDYAITWWDYGYPLWYYGDKRTLIDGGKHHNDNFVVSQILSTDSPLEAARFARIAVETYESTSREGCVINTIFKNGTKEQLNPSDYLENLRYGNVELPKKTRDIYLYLPYRMLSIFPTVMTFSNLDLMTGKEKREIKFYPTRVAGIEGNKIQLANGIIFDSVKGEVTAGVNFKKVRMVVTTQNMQNGQFTSQKQLFHSDGEYNIVFMKSYGDFIVMDNETFNSTYVQMFMLENYDKNLFEPVIMNPYTKIYKLKV